MAAPTYRLPRLYVERALEGASLTLDEREAHYLGRVLRLERGARLIVFNGRGSERHASVDSLQRRGAVLALAAEHAPLPEPSLDLTLIQALPKSDAMDLVVQKATELGANAVVPVYTEHGVVKLDVQRSERRLDHWRKIAQSACEQCGRHRPPRIDPPASLAAALEALLPGDARFALEPSAQRALVGEPLPAPRVTVAIGPEGGFGPADWRRLAGAKFTQVSLGPRVLRAETAAIALCAVVQSQWGDLR